MQCEALLNRPRELEGVEGDNETTRQAVFSALVALMRETRTSA